MARTPDEARAEFERLLGGPLSPNSRGRAVARCPLHDDSTPSLEVDLGAGTWKCYGCGAGGTLRDLAKRVATNRGEPVPKLSAIAPELIDVYARALEAAPVILDALRNERGLTDAVIKRRRLGYDGDRVWIPVYDDDGNCVNVRKWRASGKHPKIVSYAEGYGEQDALYPVDNLSGQEVVLCEGEMDALAAESRGVPCVTSTGGAGRWDPRFNARFAGKHVRVCYDVDAAGRKGAVRAARSLLAVASEVRVVTLPLTGGKADKDLTDFFVKNEGTKERFEALVAAAPVIRPSVGNRGGVKEGDPSEVKLARASSAENTLTRIRTRVRVAGKDLAPYVVPKRITFRCDVDQKMCGACSVSEHGGKLDLDLMPDSPELIEFVSVPTEKVDATTREIAGVVQRCKAVAIATEEHYNVSAVRVIPEIDFTAEQTETYVVRNVYVVGPDVELNRAYELVGIPVPEPKTQASTMLAYEVTAIEDPVDRFRPDDEALHALEVFRPDNDPKDEEIPI